MTKVLHLISNIGTGMGGPSFALVGLAKAQRKSGMDVSILATFAKSDNLRLSEEITAAGIDLRLVGPTYSSWRWHPKLRQQLRQLAAEADVLHLHGIFEAIHFYASKIAKPYILRPCGMLTEYCLKQKSTKKSFYLHCFGNAIVANASLIHCTSTSEKNAMNLVGIKAKAISIGNGIAPTQLDSPNISASKENYLLFLGRINPIKRIELIIASLPHLPKGIRLLIAGPEEEDNNYRQLLAAEINKLDLSNRVEFLGPVFGEHKSKLLAQARCLILPSNHENFANVVIEALAAGTPAVVSPHVALGAELVANNIGLISRQSPEELSAAINQLLELGTQQQSEMQERARNFVAANYLWPEIAKLWSREYSAILSAEPSNG